MQNIKPISDLRNYTEVLKEVSYGSPVYLTRNGRGEYAIIRMEELDKLKALNQLLTKLQKAEQSAREEGWISADDLEKELKGHSDIESSSNC